MDLKLWLKERELNARRIASRKIIADRSLWIEDATNFKAAYDAIQRVESQEPKPIDMVLHCPACGLQHIDAPDDRSPGWRNESHRSHLCHGCGHIWRHADVPTNGVAEIKTKGKADSPVAQKAGAVFKPEPVANWNEDRQSELNDWFLSLPEGRQKALISDKWMLAGAAFIAGKATPIARPLSDEQRKAVISAAENALDENINLSLRDALINEVERAHGIKGD